MNRNPSLTESWLMIAAGCLLLGSGVNDALAKEDLFSEQVMPILQRRCLSCHDETQAKGELSLETPANLMDNGYVLPGEPEESHLLEVITSQDGQAPAMPKDGEPLSKEEVATIRQWIAAGAVWPENIRLLPATFPMRIGGRSGPSRSLTCLSLTKQVRSGLARRLTLSSGTVFQNNL